MSNHSPTFPATPQPGAFGPGPRPGVPGPASVPAAQPEKAKKSRTNNSKSGRRFGRIAIGLAVVTFLGLLLMLGSSPAPEKAFVVRATQAINPGVDVTASAIRAEPADPADVEPGAIFGASAEEAMERATGIQLGPDGVDWAVVGRRAVYPVFAGQQLRPEMFTSASAGRVLGPDERLVSVTADVDTALAGSLRVGDVVDILGVSDDNSVLLAEAAEIVAVQTDPSLFRAAQQRQASAEGSDLEPGDVLPATPIPGMYIVRVPLASAVALAAADGKNEDLYLLARSVEADSLPLIGTRYSAVCELFLPNRAQEARDAEESSDQIVALSVRYADVCTDPTWLTTEERGAFDEATAVKTQPAFDGAQG
jgi:hypothetical protein